MILLNNMFALRQWKEEETTGRPQADITLIADHPIYRAHFPGKPVTPGVCIIRIITELLSLRLQQPLQLHAVRNLKFIRPISPVEDPALTIFFDSVKESGEGIAVRGTIVHETRIYTKFSMIYQQR